MLLGNYTGHIYGYEQRIKVLKRARRGNRMSARFLCFREASWSYIWLGQGIRVLKCLRRGTE